jgi:uncharacterized membrane protein (UPF0182 family)
MHSIEKSAPVSRKALWTGRIITGLLVLFFLFDSITKLLRVPQVVAAAAPNGFSARELVGIGAVLLICTAIYVIPRTSVLGAILLTGYLGGATFANVHFGMPVVVTFIPVVFGILTWLPIFLRDPRLRALIPLQEK